VFGSKINNIINAFVKKIIINITMVGVAKYMLLFVLVFKCFGLIIHIVWIISFLSYGSDCKRKINQIYPMNAKK
jgi:hypothetical protein